ncbi:uncharacterized protein LOC136084647 [Hydra vulgaris]|uniref:Uncharacterized protein LOC136084647 n=1 Tax=Hydra vulgaris TaxID=6087 RepID=A0ABM4CHD3_HYDVU
MGNASGCHLKVPLRFVKLSQPCRHQPLIGRYTLLGFYTLQICVYEEAQSHLEKAADSNIETDTEEKKGTKQKRKTAMTFCESDEDIVVGDEELYGRYYFDSSNS